MADQQFPITDKSGKLRVDFSPGAREGKGSYTVYYWATRPDAEQHIDTDKEHWHPDSEHETFEAAERRLTDLQSGGKRKSIYRKG